MPGTIWAWPTCAWRKFDDAVAAFRKQLEIDPFDEHANDYLGVASRQQQKFPKPPPRSANRSELNPLDKVAHAALGRFFSSSKVSPKPCPNSKKPPSSRRTTPQLQVSLGHAYLDTGQKDKGLAAFDKARELSPTPEGLEQHRLRSRREQDRSRQSPAIRGIRHFVPPRRLCGISSCCISRPTRSERSRKHRRLLGHARLDLFRRKAISQRPSATSARPGTSQNGDVGDHLAQHLRKAWRERSKPITSSRSLSPRRIPFPKRALA